MLRIRLRRTGTKNSPFFRVVVSDRKKTPITRFVDDVGYYNPQALPATFSLKLDQIDGWLDKGAIPSSTVGRMILAARAGRETLGKTEAVVKKAAAPVAEAKTDAPAETVSDTPETKADTPAETVSDTPETKADTPAETASDTPETKTDAPAEVSSETSEAKADAPAETASDTPEAKADAPAETASDTPEVAAEGESSDSDSEKSDA